jgi:hypothetical protein
MSTLLASADALFDSASEATEFNASRCPAALGALFDKVENHFRLRDADWDTLFRYALRHPQSIPVLAEAPEAIRRVFGPVRPFVDLVEDPEEDREELFIVVPTREPARQALDRLARLDAEWFNVAARRSGFAITVTVEADV